MRLFLFLSFIVLQSAALGQDERFFRGIFTEELLDKERKPVYKVEVSTSAYLIDLNRDGLSEKIRVLKKDGIDFFQILDRFGRTRFEAKLEAKGFQSSLYKARLKSLSANTDALILYFDEGNAGTTVFQSTARLYFVTIEYRDLKKIYMGKGPAFYYEKEKLDTFYSRRFYNVSVFDYNKDGVKEISAAYNHIQKIYFYQGKGKWIKL